MINLQEVNERLNKIQQGWTISFPQPIEIQYKYEDIYLEEKHLMLLSSKVGMPQLMVVKVDLDGNLKEIYPSCGSNDSNLRHLKYKKNTVPYYSCEVKDNRFIFPPNHLYWVIEKGFFDKTEMIYRRDIHSVIDSRMYIVFQDHNLIKQFFYSDLQEFLLKDDPNNIITYHDSMDLPIFGNKIKPVSCLLAFLPGHKKYNELLQKYFIL